MLKDLSAANSKNVTWGIEKAFQEGRVRYVLHQTLGYRAGEDGKPVIVEDEAQYVRMIFKMFSEGISMRDIADKMNELQVKRRNGSSVWSRNNVKVILVNEKYVGDAILQKSYTVDCLMHERAENTGQKPQYYLRDCHPAIIDRDTWNRARLEMTRRSAESEGAKARISKGKNRSKKKPKENIYYTKYSLNEILRCPYCGSSFKRTIWKSKGKGVGVWRCGKRLEFGKSKCAKSPSIHEEKLHRTLVRAVNSMIEDRERLNKTVLEALESKRADLKENNDERTEIRARLGEIDKKRSDILSLVSGSSFERFRDELKSLNTEEEELKIRDEELEKQNDSIEFSIQQITRARETYAAMEPLEAFDDFTMKKLIERIDVVGKTKVKIFFKGGMEMDVEVEK